MRKQTRGDEDCESVSLAVTDQPVGDSPTRALWRAVLVDLASRELGNLQRDFDGDALDHDSLETAELTA